MFNLNTYTVVEREGYIETQVDNIDDLIELIRPDKLNCLTLMDEDNSKNNEENLSNHLIFRGQADSMWNLEPSLFRINIEYNFNKFLYFEKNIISNFEYFCDHGEISIPGDTLKSRNKRIENFHKSINENRTLAFDENDFELLAFAQHYGVPTRLLDWSYQPLVGLYFAAIEAIRIYDEQKTKTEESKRKTFSLWVLHAEKLVDTEDIILLEVPASHNRHISKQAGCFTVVKEFDANLVNTMYYKPQTIEQILHKNQSPRVLLKINIELKIATQVVHYCSSYGFDGVKLFGGAYGAAKSSNDWLLLKKIKALK